MKQIIWNARKVMLIAIVFVSTLIFSFSLILFTCQPVTRQLFFLSANTLPLVQQQYTFLFPLRGPDKIRSGPSDRCG